MFLHDFDVAFCVKSNVAEWEELPPSVVLSALRKRVAELTEDEVLDAVGFLNTISVDDPETVIPHPICYNCDFAIELNHGILQPSFRTR